MTDAESFINEALKKPHTHRLPSGMVFTLIDRVDSTDGKKSPKLNDPCKVHYHGTLTSGKVFDSSMDRGSPASFAPSQVIKGWTEALQYMSEGEQWQVILPPQLAYGSRGAGGAIPPNATLVFKIQLLQVVSGGKPAAEGHAALEKALNKKYAEL